MRRSLVFTAFLLACVEDRAVEGGEAPGQLLPKG